MRPLPPVLRAESVCENCFQAAECMAYHAAIESGEAKACGTEELYRFSTRGFTSPQHMQYFIHWDRLLDLEASASVSSLHLTWSSSSAQREAAGSACVGALSIVSFRPASQDDKKSSASIGLFEAPPAVSGPGEEAPVEDPLPASGVAYVLTLRRDARNSYSGAATASSPLQARVDSASSVCVGDKVLVSVESEGGPAEPHRLYVEPNLCSGVVIQAAAPSDRRPGAREEEVYRIGLDRIPHRLLG
jgi:hypothetical protein